VLVALGVGALLSSGALVGLAERQPLGTQRDVALGAANAADRVAHALSLNRPAAELAAALDGEPEVYDVDALIARARASAAAAPAPGPSSPPPPVTEDPEIDESPPPPAGPDRSADQRPAASGEPEPEGGTTSEPDRIADRRPAASGEPDTEGGTPSEPDRIADRIIPQIEGPDCVPQDPSGGEEGPGSAAQVACPPGQVAAGPDGTPIPAAATDPETEPEVTFDAPRQPDEDDPLELYVGGDSISRDLGEGLARVTPANLVRIDLDPRPATGLSRPDFFDWSQHLAGVLTETAPDVFVVMFGANDFQNVEHEGEILDRFGDEWLELYRERVDRIMILLSQPDTQTIWVGQPPVREERLSGGLRRMNTVYAETAAEHPQVTFVDTWDHFSGDGGGYVDEMDGVRLRREDGVHLTIAGGNHLAEAVWQVIGPTWGLE
jgi:hypothetical protein